MTKELERLEEEARAALGAVSDDGLVTWRAAYLGRRGKVTDAVKAVGTLPPEERPAYGRRANEVKRALEAAYEARVAELAQARVTRSLAADAVDVTLPGRTRYPG